MRQVKVAAIQMQCSKNPEENRKKAEEMGITDWKISITNTKEVATAFVIAVADDVKE